MLKQRDKMREKRRGNQVVVKAPVYLKDEKYPYLNTRDLDLTHVGSRVRGRLIYLSKRFVRGRRNNKFIEFEMINPIGLKLSNGKMVKTEKGTLVVKYEENSTLYLIEIPSGFRGSVIVEPKSGECYQTYVRMSPAGRLGEVAHIWCNGNAEFRYKINGRIEETLLIEMFGKSLSGRIIIKDNKVEIEYDE